jgi:uncharacterized protein Yka (UPF0111/DUF47 family)
MKETAELLREVAKRHRELASGLQNKEFIEDLRRLADKCESKADELTNVVAKDTTEP